MSDNSWADVLRAKAPGLVNRHYHPHEVFAYTISGKWGYLEHDWIATAGDFVYETPGEAHTLVAYECDEPMQVLFKVKGPLVWLDENGDAEGFFDVHDYMEIARRIESGICHVNSSTVHDEPQMPFGGVKSSGWGRFGGRAALEEFTELRWMTVQQGARHYPI